jgi:DNA-directed RNA polymerase specialized sigma24 family protein
VLAADPVGRAAVLIWSRDLADGRSAEERVLQRLAQTEIVVGIQPLPPRHRLAVHLTDVRGLDHWQIADLTRIPVGTVKSSLDGGGTVVIAYCCSVARMAGDFLTRSSRVP